MEIHWQILISKNFKITLKNNNLVTLNLYKKKTSYGIIDLKKKVLRFSEKKKK